MSFTIEYAKSENVTKDELIDAITTIFAFTKIGENGVAEDHTLRRVRMVNAGFEFYTSIYADDLEKREEDLLRKTIRAIQHIGTYKSKGKGLVSCEIIETIELENGKSAIELTTDEKANYVTFYIDLEEPVKMGGHGNQSNTTALNYIAGSTIRGAVIGEYIKQRLQGNSDTLDKKMIKNTEFCDAYICQGDIPMIPVPTVYFADKHKLRNHKRQEKSGGSEQLEIKNRTKEKPEEGEQKVGVNNYCILKSDSIEVTGVRKCANLHININSDDMFRYEAIDRGQRFFGIIKCNDKDSAKDIASLISESVLYLGGSKGSGYGRCRITKCDISEYSSVIEKFGISEDIRSHNKGELVVLALSNLILSDKKGKPTAYIEPEYLEEKLDIQNVRLVKHFISSVETSGFNHKWKTGNVQRSAVKAGSYYRYEYDGTINIDKLYKLEQEGIGQRKQDGFGRILFNVSLDQEKLSKASVKTEEGKRYEITDDEKDMADRIRLIIDAERQKVEIMEKAEKLSDRYINSNNDEKLSKTQVSRIYSLLNNRSTTKEEVRKFIDDLTDNTKKEYEKAYIFIEENSSKINFVEALEKLIENADTFESERELYAKILYSIMRKGGKRYD